MIRNVLLGGIVESIDSSIGGVDNGAFVDAIKDTFSFNADAFGRSFNGPNSVIYVCVIAVVCIVAMIIAYSRTYKRT